MCSPAGADDQLAVVGGQREPGPAPYPAPTALRQEPESGPGRRSTVSSAPRSSRARPVTIQVRHSPPASAAPRTVPPQLAEAMPPVITLLEGHVEPAGRRGLPVPVSGGRDVDRSGCTPGVQGIPALAGVKSSSSRAARHFPPTYLLKVLPGDGVVLSRCLVAEIHPEIDRQLSRLRSPPLPRRAPWRWPPMGHSRRHRAQPTHFSVGLAARLCPGRR